MMRALFILALAISLQPLIDADVLEPSVQNEVDHALSIVPTNVVKFADMPESFRQHCATNDFFKTNNLSKTGIAIKIISSQKSDGKWIVGTNDLTSVACEILRAL